ncbi:unnamed protein product [Paramecium sonneborni]|uniref:Uncharacterized protein n=1 Tax=Paramecium sonneborni TaxID=65129 RepID=A0A8S1RAI0_9CILI|nr:unnamed protein product [Paramecium sonneborni]
MKKVKFKQKYVELRLQNKLIGYFNQKKMEKRVEIQNSQAPNEFSDYDFSIWFHLII